MSRCRSHNSTWIILGLLIFVGSRCRDNSSPPRTGRTAEAPARDTQEIEQALGEGNATAHVEPCVDQVCSKCGEKSEMANGKW